MVVVSEDSRHRDSEYGAYMADKLEMADVVVRAEVLVVAMVETADVMVLSIVATVDVVIVMVEVQLRLITKVMVVTTA